MPETTPTPGHLLDGAVSVPDLPIPQGPAPGAPSAQPAPRCNAEYQPHRCQSGQRLVLCDLPYRHDGDHQETDTGHTWPATPTTEPTPAAADAQLGTPAVAAWAALLQEARQERDQARGELDEVRCTAGSLAQSLKQATDDREQARTELAAAERDLDHARRELEATRAEAADLRQRLDHAQDETSQAIAERIRDAIHHAITTAPDEYRQRIIAARCAKPVESADYWRWCGQAEMLRQTIDALTTRAGLPGINWERIKASVPDDGVYRRDSKPAASVPGARAPERYHHYQPSTVLSGDYCAVCGDKPAEHPAPPAQAAQAPEATCHRCGRPNITWSAPSPMWNAVMRGGHIDGDEQYDGIVCPCCFAKLAEQADIARLWRMTAEDVTADLETTTPSGRVWDDDAWLWRDPAPETTAPPAVDHAGGPESPAEGDRTNEAGPEAQGDAETATLWRCTDPDGDHVEIMPRDSGPGWIIVASPGGTYLTPDAAADLHAWLGTALGQPAAPEPGPILSAITAHQQRITTALRDIADTSAALADHIAALSKRDTGTLASTDAPTGDAQ